MPRDMRSGAQQFEVDLKVNSQDVEETVWRYLCIARSRGVTAAQNSLLVVRDDPRLVMGRVYDLYAGNCTIDDGVWSKVVDNWVHRPIVI